jgi:xylan 1,4-beta-xylosidase
LSLRLLLGSITELKAVSFVGRRHQYMNFMASTALEFTPQQQGEEAGLVLYQNHKFNYRFTLLQKNNTRYLCLVKCTDGEEKLIAEEAVEYERLYLRIEAGGQD